jgi:hypothetical protein
MIPLLILAAAFLLAWVVTRGLYRRGRLHTPWHQDIAALALLALATAGFFWRVLSGQNWMPADGGDLVSFLFPSYRFAAASLQQGALPLWNTHLYGGTPHAGDIQSGVLYPPNVLLFLTNPGFAYTSLQSLSILHIWWGGAGMFLFLVRGRGIRRLAALSGALAFMFCDVFVTHVGNLNLNAVLSWLPWVMWAFMPALGAMGPRTYLRAAVAGVLLAVATLAGHIQGTLIVALGLGVVAGLDWLLGRGDARSDGEARRLVLGYVVPLLTTLAVAALLAAPVVLPAFELAGNTARAEWGYGETVGYSLSPAQWIGWIAPGFFGRGPQFHWGAWPRVETGYLGILPLVLAGLAIALRRDRRTWTFLGLAAVSFVLALGIYAIPHGWLTLIPGFDLFRAPARFLILTDFAIAVLAAIGLEAALAPMAGRARGGLESAWRLTGGITGGYWLAAVPLAYLALLLVQDRDPAIVLRTSVSLIAIVAAGGLLAASFLWLWARRGGWARPSTLGWLAAALIFLDVASLGAYQDLGTTDPSLTYRQPAIEGFLKAQAGPFRIDTKTGIDTLWQPDTALLLGFDDVGGVANPLVLADFERYWQGLGSRSTRLYDLLNTRYVIAKKDVTLDWDKFALAFDADGELNVYENRKVLPRAFFVPGVRPVPDHETAWAAIQAPGFDPAASAVVEGAPPSGGAGVVRVERQGPNRLELEVSADGPAFLVVSQPWYPGWRASVDGGPEAVPLRTNFLFQGVPVPAGDHTVTLQYRPTYGVAGWLLAGLALLALLAGGLWARRRN